MTIVPSGYEAANAELARYLNFVTARHGDTEWVANGRTWRRQPDGTWHARSADPVHHDPEAINRAMEYGALEMRSQQQMYGWDDLKNDPVLGPKVHVVEHEDGTKEANLRGLTDVERRRLLEMESGALAVQAEISDRRSADVSLATLSDADGCTRQVPEQHAEIVAKRDGLHEKRRRMRGKP